MKILICGDSWTEGYDIKSAEAWPNFINYEFDNVAVSGSTNKQILSQFLNNYNESYDLVIIGWSGATRFIEDSLHEFSCVNKQTIKYFRDKSLVDILQSWDDCIKTVLNKSSVPIIQFSVFGDVPLIKYDKFIKEGFLEFLAEQQGMKFQYDIPIFEFDWLNEKNLKLTNSFAKKYFSKDWKRACVERELVRPGTYFLICGHPNAEGHKLWGNFIKGKIDDILLK